MKYFFSLACLIFSCAHVSQSRAQASAPVATGRVMIEQLDVTQESVAAVEAKLAELDADSNVTEIYLRINSHGGEVSAGLELAQYFDTLHKPLTCVVDYMAWSMGATILESCPTRLMTRRSTIMVHEASASVQGNAHDMADSESVARVITESLIQIMAQRVNISADAIREKITGKQWWMSAEEALAVGAVDALVSPKDLPRITPLAKSLSALEQLLHGS